MYGIRIADAWQAKFNELCTIEQKQIIKFDNCMPIYIFAQH